MPSELERAAARFRERLLAWDAETLEELTGAYGAAWERIRGELEKLTNRIEAARQAGEILSPAWLFQRNRLSALQRQARTEMDRFADGAAEHITRAQRRAVDLAQDAAQDLAAKSVGRAPVGRNVAGVFAAWTRLPRRAVEALVGFASDGSPLRELLGGLGPDAEQGAREALVAGVATGQHPRQIANHLQEHLGGGLTRALTVARTETLRAHREASRQTFEQNVDVVGSWIWTAALSRRTCLACLAMHGTEHPATESLAGHPNCRCQMVPKTKSWGELLGDDSIADTRPKIETGEAWLARQPLDVQREILGRSGLKAYQAGEVILADFAGRKESERWGPMMAARSVKEARAAGKARQSAGTAPIAAGSAGGGPPSPPSPPAAGDGGSGSGGPQGRKVSEFLRQEEEDPRVTFALEAIDRAHGVARPLPRIPIRANPQMPSDAGYQWLGAEPKRIQYSPGGRHVEGDIIHEVGHFMDHVGVDTGAHFSSDWLEHPEEWSRQFEFAAELEAWRDAVQSTQAYQRLKELQGQDMMEFPFQGSRMVCGVPHDQLKRLLAWRELWSRTYMQYVTVKSGEELLRQQLYETRHFDDGSLIPVPAQWDDDDFAPVLTAMDRLFQATGWIK